MTINFPTSLYIIGAKRKTTESEQKNPDKRTRRY